MLKNIALTALFGFAAITTFPSYASAENPRTFTGRVTARTENTITVYDKELVTVALNDQTVVEPWIREKPFVRKPTTLEPSAIKVGALVNVKIGTDHSLANVVQVANDVQTWYKGRVVETTASSVSVFDKEMAVQTLRLDDRTDFRQLFIVKPFVRKPVHLAPTDMKIGSFVEVFPSKSDRSTAERVEIVMGEPLQVPPTPLAHTDN
jgi:hypothetical protein